MSISIASRLRIRQRANFLCEYCHSSEEASTSLFTLDHLIPQSLGGDDSVSVASGFVAVGIHRRSINLDKVRG